MKLTDAKGTEVASYTYGVYGKLLSGDSSLTSILYNGRCGVSTDDNGLYYMRQRYYNPEIKRFVNQDILTGSMDNSQSLNRYCYVQGNPVSYVDPFGLSPMAALQQAGQVALGATHVILGGLSIIPTPVGIVAGALDAVLYAFLDHDIYAAATSGLGALGMGFGNIAGMAMGGSKLSVSAAVAEVLCDVAGGVVSFNDPRNAGDNNTLETFGTVALVAVLGTVGATVGSKMFGKNAGRAIDNVMDEVVEHSDDAGRVFSKVDDVAVDVARASNKSNSGSSNQLAYNLQLFGGGTSSGRDASGRLNISLQFFGGGSPKSGKTPKTPTWKGSGPVPGVIGINANSTSNAAINNYNPKEGIEFVFDASTNTFVVGKNKHNKGWGSPHQKLAQSIGANQDASTTLGGVFSRGPDGKIYTNENSGHFGRNWTSALRTQFVETMREYDVEVIHEIWK